MSLFELIGDYESENEDEPTETVQNTSDKYEEDNSVIVKEKVQDEKRILKYPHLKNLPPPSADAPDPAVLELLRQHQNNPNHKFDLIEVSFLVAFIFFFNSIKEHQIKQVFW
jgi:hypothetical protein